jgi:hypothetical protein
MRYAVLFGGAIWLTGTMKRTGQSICNQKAKPDQFTTAAFGEVFDGLTIANTLPIIFEAPGLPEVPTPIECIRLRTQRSGGR